MKDFDFKEITLEATKDKEVAYWFFGYITQLEKRELYCEINGGDVISWNSIVKDIIAASEGVLSASDIMSGENNWGGYIVFKDDTHVVLKPGNTEWKEANPPAPVRETYKIYQFRHNGEGEHHE